MPSIPSTGYRFYDFASLDIGSNIIAEYVWIDGTGVNTRSKSRTLKGPIKTVADLPEWNYDGSSTYQACTENSEIILKPCAMYKDPFRGGENLIVVCETYQWKDGTFQELIPTLSNFRHLAKKVFDSPAKDGENGETAQEKEEPWYGIEQEYTLFNRSETNQRWPLGWPAGGFPGPQGPYYCSVGAMVSFGRPVMDAHYRACLAAGVQISGSNAEVMPGQWEYQVGPCLGIAIGDQMVVSRYLLTRVCEDFNLAVSFLPKPIKGDWNGAGCHTNFSTVKMRATGGIEVIKKACDALGQYHERHIAVYGAENEKRLTGKHETSSIKDFSYGVGNRGSSVRIPVDTAAKGMGYLEDRRPASNIDPYLVSSMIFDTCCCDAALGKELGESFEKFNATAVPPEDYSSS